MLRSRRWLVLLLAAVLALIAVPGLAESPSDYNRNTPQVLRTGHLNSDAAILIDAQNGDILFSKNSRDRMYPASTTKIMTLMLALESGIDMDTRIVIPQAAAKVPVDSSLVPVFPGDEMTFRDLLYGFMLSSGNDGANAVAVLVSGSTEAFVERMNARAKEIGCTGTHFANAHGYHDENHYSTAYDLALIAQNALRLESFRSIVGTYTYTLNIKRGRDNIKTAVRNGDTLLNEESGYYYKDAIGIKTGYHSSAGQCFVGATERDGITLISVVLHGAASTDKWVDTIRLFNYGYTRYTAYTLEQIYNLASPQIATLKISNAARNDPNDGILNMRIAQISDPDYTRMVETNNEAALEAAITDFVSRCELTITGSMAAPISAGEVMGNLRYVDQSGQEITAKLIADRNVAEQPPKTSFYTIFPALSFLKNPLWILLILVLILLVILLLIAGSVRRNRKQRRRKEIYEERRREYIRQTEAQRRRNAKVHRKQGSTIVKRVDSRFDDEEDDEWFGGF